MSEDQNSPDYWNNPNRWQFEKQGMGYRVWSDEVLTEIRISHLKRSRGELTGELSIKANLKGVKTRPTPIRDNKFGGLMHVARFNVLSSSARSSLAKLLLSRTSAYFADFDWFDALEWLCQGVILAEQEGEAVVSVGNAPARSMHDKFLIEPLILKGQSSLLYGPGGSGKSLIALACGLSVATGLEILPGMLPAVQGNVLYLDWETEQAEINDRIQAIAAGAGFTPSGMFYRQCRRPLADEVETVSDIVAEHHVVLVIVDSAAFAMGSQGEYGDSNESTIKLYSGLRLLGTSVQVIDHVNRVDTRTPPGKAAPYGSVYKDNAARMNWEIRKLTGDSVPKVGLYHHKTNNTATLPSFGLEVDWSDGAVVFRPTSVGRTEATVERVMDTADLIRELLADGDAMPMHAICSTLASPTRKYDTIKKTVYRMADRGELEKIDQGYKLSTSVINFPKVPFDA